MEGLTEMRWAKSKEKPNEFLIVLYNLSKGGRETVPFNILVKECKIRPVVLQKAVNEFAKEGLVRYVPPSPGDNPSQMGGVVLTNIGIAKMENA